MLAPKNRGTSEIHWHANIPSQVHPQLITGGITTKNTAGKRNRVALA